MGARLILILFFVLIVGDNKLFAFDNKDEPLVIYTLEIDGVHQKDNGGAYDFVIQKVIQQTKLAIQIENTAPARAFRNFENCYRCCISPANIDTEFYDFEGVQQTKSLGSAKIVVFTKPGTPIISSLAELKGLNVSARYGMPLGRSIENSDLPLLRPNSIESSIKMLQRGRVDAFLAYVPDAYEIFKRLNLTPFPHNAENPLFWHEDRIVCKGENISEFIKEINNYLAQNK